MTLAAGQHLGSYEILSPIGAGGMGEVYRARDTKLGRDVAIKVLPEAFAADHDRMVRFQREAHQAAELQTEEKRDKVVFIQNFFEELRRVAPAAKR